MQKHLLVLVLLVSCTIYAMEDQQDHKRAKTIGAQEVSPDQTTSAAEPLYKKIRNLPALSAGECLAIGQKHTIDGNWQAAVDMYQEVITTQAKIHEQYVAFKNLGILHTLNGTGALIQTLKPSESFHKAIEYFNQAIMCLNQTLQSEPLLQKNVASELSQLYTFYAIACKESCKLTTAIICAQRALKCLPDRPTRISLYTILGQSYRPTDLVVSEKYLKMGVSEALQLPQDIHHEKSINDIFASLYKELGNTELLKYKKHDVNGPRILEQAHLYFNRSIMLNIGLQHRSNIWVQLAFIYKQQGRIHEAKHTLSLATQQAVKEVNPVAHAAAQALINKI